VDPGGAVRQFAGVANRAVPDAMRRTVLHELRTRGVVNQAT
jgi:hypothetical protein